MSAQNNSGAPKPPTPHGAPDFRIKAHKGSHINKVIAVVSGKGGVGKSSVTGMSALWARRKGYQTAILDADITGPSIPKMFGVGYPDLVATEECLYPANTVTGIKVMSMNLLTKQEDAPVIWRSPVIFIDMPPGTGDVPLTVFQSLPIDGIIVVTTPQDLVSMIVKKALGMARLMKVPVLGIVENMSYVKCPHCGEEIRIFGDSHVEEIAAKENIPVIARIPIDPEMTGFFDTGKAEYYESTFMEGLKDILPPIE